MDDERSHEILKTHEIYKAIEALRALARADQTRGASPETGARLMAEFRLRRAARVWRRAAMWTLATAAGVAALVLLTPRTERSAPPPSPVTLQRPEAVPTQAPPATPTPVPTRRLRRARTALAVRQDRGAAPRDTPRRQEMVTDFYPLLNPAPPLERGQILRVNVPASVMQSVGFPVAEDRLTEPVQADVLLGEEGLPRAIRFVGFQVR